MGGPVLSPPSDASCLAGQGLGGEGRQAGWQAGKREMLSMLHFRDLAALPRQRTGQVRGRGSVRAEVLILTPSGRWGVHGSIPLQREVLGLSWLWGLPGSGKRLPESTGDLVG